MKWNWIKTYQAVRLRTRITRTHHPIKSPGTDVGRFLGYQNPNVRWLPSGYLCHSHGKVHHAKKERSTIYFD